MPTRREAVKQSQIGHLTRTQLLRLLKVSDRQLRVWERKGWIHPTRDDAPGAHRTPLFRSHPSSPDPDREPFYTLADLSALKTILKLRQSGVPVRQLRAFQEAFQSAACPSSRIWNDLQLQPHGKRLSVSHQGARLEPLTGQYVLDFSLTDGNSKLRRFDEHKAPARDQEVERRARADRMFLAALRYEERPRTLSKAIRGYQKVIELNPRAVGAYINLGTIYYHQGSLEEAENCYRAALKLNPRSALVHFNLGNLLEEKEQWEASRSQYEEALRLDSNYPDPRFNLAMLYERLGRHGKACQQWRAYLKLDSESRWADYARQQLANIPLRVVPPRTPQSDPG